MYLALSGHHVGTLFIGYLTCQYKSKYFRWRIDNASEVILAWVDASNGPVRL